MNWWRCHHGMPTDAKLGLVAHRAGARKCEVGWVWVILLDRASQAENRGCIDGFDCDEIGMASDIESDTVRKIIDVFRERRMLSADNILTAWDKRQPRREREDGEETSTERVRRFRDAKRVQRQETPGNARKQSGTPGNTQIRGEEIRGEEKTTTTEIAVPRLTEYPKTDAAVRRCFATADLIIVSQIIQAGTQAFLSIDTPKIPVMGDEDFAAAVVQAWKEATNQTSAALFKTTVPAVVKSWCLHGRTMAARAGPQQKSVVSDVARVIQGRLEKGDKPW